MAHYEQINSTLAEELRAEGCEGLAGDKATLYSARSFSPPPKVTAFISSSELSWCVGVDAVVGWFEQGRGGTGAAETGQQPAERTASLPGQRDALGEHPGLDSQLALGVVGFI